MQHLLFGFAAVSTPLLVFVKHVGGLYASTEPIFSGLQRFLCQLFGRL